MKRAFWILLAVLSIPFVGNALVDRVKRALVVTLVLLVSGAASAQPRTAQRPAPRNVVVILTDDHRYDFMGFHPDAPAFLRTPHLDRMAAGGASSASGLRLESNLPLL